MPAPPAFQIQKLSPAAIIYKQLVPIHILSFHLFALLRSLYYLKAANSLDIKRQTYPVCQVETLMVVNSTIMLHFFNPTLP